MLYLNKVTRVRTHMN